MKSTQAAAALALVTLLAPLAQANKCGQVVYNKHGMLRKYEVLPLDLSESWKKHGSSSTSGATTETSTASVDPGVSTGASDSQTQSLSTRGDCKWGGLFGTAETKDYQNYVEQNMNEIKAQIAVAEGGHIEMIAAFAGCPQPAVLGQSLQKNIKKFVDLNDEDSKIFVDEVRQVISADSTLSKQCASQFLAKK